MAIITLTTDLGLKDHFVGVLKGKILGAFPEATIVDISHHIDPFNIVEGYYVLQASYHHFPKGTVHFIGIDTEKNVENKHVALLLDGHYFVGTDNGIMNMLAQKIMPEQMVEINLDNVNNTAFSDVDALIATSIHLAKGGVLSLVGKPLNHLKEVLFMPAKYAEDQNLLTGIVIYIDHFGNAVTNITKSLFENVRAGRSFVIEKKPFIIKRILKKYSEIMTNDQETLKSYEGKELAIFNEAGFLEIAIFRSNPNTVGSANSLLGLEISDQINIKFN
jgi:S-adenosylmethionine hydrolase